MAELQPGDDVALPLFTLNNSVPLLKRAKVVSSSGSVTRAALLEDTSAIGEGRTIDLLTFGPGDFVTPVSFGPLQRVILLDGTTLHHAIHIEIRDFNDGAAVERYSWHRCFHIGKATVAAKLSICAAVICVSAFSHCRAADQVCMRRIKAAAPLSF